MISHAKKESLRQPVSPAHALPLTLLLACRDSLSLPPASALFPPAAFILFAHPGLDVCVCSRSAGHLLVQIPRRATYSHFARLLLVPPTTACPSPLTLCVYVTYESTIVRSAHAASLARSSRYAQPYTAPVRLLVRLDPTRLFAPRLPFCCRPPSSYSPHHPVLP